jgi:hypothetical protein
MNPTSGSSTAKSTTHAKKKSRKTTVEEVEDEDSPQNISARNRAASPDHDPPAPTETMSSNTEQKKKVCISMPCVTVLTLYVFQKSGGVKYMLLGFFGDEFTVDSPAFKSMSR